MTTEGAFSRRDPEPARAPEKSLAVLPFVDLSPQGESEFFADGITEEILSALAALPDLRVAGRTSSFSFKGKRIEPREIARQLKVRAVLEGTVRREGGRVRLTAQLLDAADGSTLWAERFDREVGDVFAVQEEIARAIATRLEATRKATGRETLAERSTGSIAAYESYLKGRTLLYRRGIHIREGLALMQQALELDPLYAPAWAGRADGYSLLGQFGYLPPEFCAVPAREAAARALELGPNLAEAHNAQAQVSLLFDWDWTRTQREFRRALELDPNYLQATAWYGLFYLGVACGRWGEAIELFEAAAQKEPLSAYAMSGLALSRGYGGQVKESVRTAERAVQLDRSSFTALWALQNLLYLDRQYARSLDVGEQLMLLSGRHPWALLNTAMTCAEAGDPFGARAIHDEFTARASRGYISPFHRGIVAAAAGEPAMATGLLREAVARRDPAIAIFAGWFGEHWAVADLPAMDEVTAAVALPNCGRKGRQGGRTAGRQGGRR
jgi:serine/threonine-protein kinase